MREREQIEKLQSRVNKCIAVADFGYLALVLLSWLAIELFDGVALMIADWLWLIWLPVTFVSGKAVYLNRKLPEKDRLRTTNWWSSMFLGKGPVYTFVIVAGTNLVFFGLMIYCLLPR